MTTDMTKKSALSAIALFMTVFFFASPCSALRDTDFKKQIPSRIQQKTPGPAIKAPSHAIFPTILTVAPAILTQGQKTTLIISGQNLKGNMLLKFGAGITTENWNLSNDIGTMASLQVTVAPDTIPGTRVINIVYNDQIRPSNATVNIMETYRQPVVRSVSPNMFTQGRSYTVSLNGANLSSVKQIDFGPDIRVNLGPDNPSSNLIRMELQVSGQAALGPRQVKIIDQKGSHETSAVATVIAAIPLPSRPSPPAPPDVPKTKLPAQKIPDPLTKKTPDLQKLGVQTPQIPSKTRLPANIKKPLLADIQFTKGIIELKTPEFGKFMMMENWESDHGIPTANDAVIFTWDEKQHGTSQWFELRILDKDNTVLMTRKIEGGAPPDSFYSPDVSFMTELFNYFRPESDNTSQSSQKSTAQNAAGVSQKAFIKNNIDPATAGQVSTTASANSLIQNISQPIDCYWQVAGFKRFTSGTYQIQTGTNNMTSTDVEVAVSDRWPLQLPEFSPTGLLCSSANTPLTAKKVHDQPGQTVEDHNFYVGDTLEVTGQFTLDGCPWAIGYNTEWSFVSHGEVSDSFKVKRWSFSNVFIDWGDGEWDYVLALPTQEMLAFEGDGTQTSTPGGTSYEPGDDTQPPQGQIKISMTHTYRYAQKFPVRVFVLPEDDAGHIQAIVNANKAQKGESVYQAQHQNQTGFFDNQTLLAASSITASDAIGSGPVVSKAFKAEKTTIKDISKSKANVSFSSAGYSVASGLENMGDRAFLIYCQPKIVDIKADPASTGPLHLIDLSITGFSGQAQSTQTTIDPDLISKRKNQARGNSSAKNDQNPKRQYTVSQQNNVSAQGNAQNLHATSNQVTQSALQTLRPASDAQASSCDEGFYAIAELEYFGLGRIHLSWKIDGEQIAKTIENIGPSPVRTELGQDYQYTEDVKHGIQTFTSPKLPLEVAGAYKTYDITVSATIEGYEGAMLIPPMNSGHGGQQAPAQAPYITYVHKKSETRTYLVNGPIAGLPCAFKFPVEDDQFFTISNIQGRVTKTNGKYSGMGTLYFTLPDSPGSMSTYFADIHIHNWEVNDEQVVTKGSISETSLNIALNDLPGVTGTLKQLNGSARKPLTAAMDIFIKDPGLHRVGALTPPQWLNIQAPLIPQDGWYAQGLAMPETLIYWSGCRISSNDVRLDLSRLRGNKPIKTIAGSTGKNTSSNASGRKSAGLKQNTRSAESRKTKPKITAAQGTGINTAHLSQSGPGMTVMLPPWAGVHLGDTATLYPFVFGIIESLSVSANGWSIQNSGIDGKAAYNNFSYVLGQGSISFDSIDITAENHALDAVYKNVQVNIPWPEISLKGGDATAHYVQGQSAAKVEFVFDTDNLSVTEHYQNITMTSRVKNLEKMGSGWGIFTDTTFDFTDGRKPFATVELTDLFFNVFEEAHFEGTGDQTHQRFIPVNGSTTLGDAQLTLTGLNVFAPADKLKPERLSFTFNGQINFHDAFNADDITISYTLDKPLGKGITASGPAHSQITINSTYPGDVNPLVHIKVHPEISLPGTIGPVSSDLQDSPPSFSFISSAHADAGVQDSFTGEVDSTMFGDVPLGVKAKFRYGTYNGKPYWLSHVIASGIDVPIFTNGVNLKKVNGGLAHGFKENVFSNAPMTAVPDNPGKTIYSAGITIGSPEPTEIYQLTGQLTVNPEDMIFRMDFSSVRIFGIGLGGGHFEYGNSIFEGNIFGGFSLYQGAISCQIPQNSEKVGLHFGDDYWEIWAGRKEDPLTLNLFNTINTKGFYQFGSIVGFQVGGALSFDTGKICAGIFAAKAYANASMLIHISPKVLEGEFGIGAGINAYVPCSGSLWDGSLSQTVWVSVKAPPLKMKAKLVIDVPDWIPEVPDDVTFRFDI
ncbi:MAG: hypothetical protein KKD32_19715 [Proteobacteria bacterium]|nr:hypothetical protein [Pseudomonadota bacterium]